MHEGSEVAAEVSEFPQVPERGVHSLHGPEVAEEGANQHTL